MSNHGLLPRFTVILINAESQSLAIDNDLDASHRFQFDTIREVREFLATHTSGYRATDDLEVVSEDVTSFRVYEGREDQTAFFAAPAFKAGDRVASKARPNLTRGTVTHASGDQVDVITDGHSPRTFRAADLIPAPFKVGDQVAYNGSTGLVRPGVIVTVITDTATGLVERYGVRYDGADPRSRREVVFMATPDSIRPRGL